MAIPPSMASVPRTLPPTGAPFPTMSGNPSPRTNLVSVPSTTFPSNYNYGAALPQSQAFPYANQLDAKTMVPGASRDLLDGGYVYTGAGDTEQLFVKQPQPAVSRKNFDLGAAVFLVPIIFFACVYWVVAFQIRFYMPIVAWLFVLLCLGAVAAAGFLCFTWAMQDKAAEAVWSFFLCIAMLIALVVAVSCACKTYTNITEPLYARKGLNHYAGVDPATADGTSFMDAGSLQFSNGAYIDNSKSGGFMNLDMYCVAPIVSKTSATPATYDFWAVGLNCCTGNHDFQCVNNGDSLGYTSGLRLMSNSQQEFFKLAVSKTAAAYNMKAVHPLFFSFVKDVNSGNDHIASLAAQNLLNSTMHFALFQLFLTLIASLAALWFTSRVK